MLHESQPDAVQPQPMGSAERTSEDELDWDALYRLAHRRVRGKMPELSPADREDIVSECVAQLLQYRRDHDVQSDEGLLVRIAMARCADRIRGNRGDSVDIDEMFDLAADGTDPAVLDGYESIRLAALTVHEVFHAHETVASKRKNAAIRCSEIAKSIELGHKWTDLGDIMNVPANTIAQRWKRCRDKFWQLVEKRGLRPSFMDWSQEGGSE